MSETATITLIVIESVGLVITIGFGIAAFIAYRKAKAEAKKFREKAAKVGDAMAQFTAALQNI